jgi:multidrug efflux pump subunit AcrA (membrane-fusion protein)
MIAGMMAGQMNQEQSQEVIDRYHKYMEMKAKLAKQLAELEDLRRQLAEAQKLLEQARMALAELQALQKKHQETVAKSGAKEQQELLAEANRLRARIAQLQPLPAQLQATIEDLKKQVALAKLRRSEATVRVRPGGSGVDIEPTFVECTASSLLIHEGAEPKRILYADVSKADGEYRKLLDRVAGTPKGQVIFLIRPDAVNVYAVARSTAQTHFGPNGYCKTGKLPVPTQGHIDLSGLRR